MYNYFIMKKTIKFKDYIVLTSTEERILQCLISKKSGRSISEISNVIKLSRTSIYNGMGKLIKKNLVSKKGFSYFLINKKWSLYDSEKNIPRAKIKDVMSEMLRLKKNEIIYSIEPNEEIKELFSSSKKELLIWQKTVAQKGIILKGIGTKKALTLLRPMLNRGLTEVIKKRSGSARFMNEDIKGSCTLVSFRNSVIFFSRSKDFFYRIDDPNVSIFVQGIIDSLYNFLQHYPIVEDQ